MGFKSLAVAAVCCAAVAQGAFAQSSAPTAPRAAGTVVSQPPAQWPLVLPEKGVAKPLAESWSARDIELAQARCAAVLKGLAVVAVPEAPIREGAMCGAAAPMKLISVGKVTLTPPPIVTCDMIAALHRWLERDVQPLARKHLGASVVRIETMSSYSCRNAYNRVGPRGRLSEHGRANAVDIGAFVTTRGQMAMVVADWGPTARQIAAEAASANAAAHKAAAAKSATPAPMQPVAVERPRVLQADPTLSIPGIAVMLPSLSSPGAPAAMGWAQPSRLGGPKPVPAIGPGGKMDFLRGAHSTACKLFYTVLGPEANSAHENHFHLDMAERIKNTKVCE
jgi:hypothetical protein